MQEWEHFHILASIEEFMGLNLEERERDGWEFVAAFRDDPEGLRYWRLIFRQKIFRREKK